MSNELDVSIIGDKELSRAFEIAPRAFTIATRKWYFDEIKSFVGNKKSDGYFRKLLMRKPKQFGDGTWSGKVAKRFKGYVDNPNNLSRMSMHMGVGLQGDNRFDKGIAKMQTGYSANAKAGGWMIVPFKDNLRSLDKPIKGAYMKAFKRLIETSSLDPVIINGKLYFFDDRGVKGAKKQPLFIGYKRVTIKKQFSFYEKWNERLAKVFIRGDKRMARTVDAIQRGRIEAK